jgi:HK97 family phage major capsid protein
MASATITENGRLLDQLTREKLLRRSDGRPINKKQLVAAMRATIQRVEAQRILGEHPFSISRAIRGALAIKGEVLDTESVETDVAYAKALGSGTQPGSFLMPTLQGNTILQQLAQFAVARAAGARIWDLSGALNLSIPVGAVSPSVIWQAQNSRQTQDAAMNLTGLNFSLKEQIALVALPLQLLRTSKPTFDAILGETFAAALSESEDVAQFSSVQLPNAPVPFQLAPGVTTINAANGSVNGGNLLYGDLLAMLLKASQLKMKPPLVWFCSPRTMYQRLLGLADTTSRPLLIPDLSDPATSGFSLLGFPLYVTSSISETQALGSGTNQSSLILTKPSSLNIAQDGDVSMVVSLESLFDSAQAALRISHQVDWGVAPAASLIVLQGVN